jgi:hypothetical protein
MRSLALAAMLLLAAIPARAQDAAAVAATNSFYTATQALPRAGGIPAPAARARLQSLLSTRLGALIGQAAAAEARFRAANKFAPPLLEGDLFSSLFEGPASFKVGACTGTAMAQRCRVQFNRPPEPGARGPVRPADWGDDLLLVNEGGGWKVDDVDYRGGFAFGNTGLLSQTLAMVIRAAS